MTLCQKKVWLNPMTEMVRQEKKPHSSKWRTNEQRKGTKRRVGTETKGLGLLFWSLSRDFSGSGFGPRAFEMTVTETLARTHSHNSYVKIMYFQSFCWSVCMQPQPCQSLHCKILDDCCTPWGLNRIWALQVCKHSLFGLHLATANRTTDLQSTAA